MTGWNLPPGCNVSDIPGHRPADIAYEKAREAFEAKLAGLVRDAVEGGLEWRDIREALLSEAEDDAA